MKVTPDQIKEIRERFNSSADFDTDDLFRWMETLLQAVEERETAIDKALIAAIRYAGIDGSHHKTWTIDQMVRALTACPQVQKTAKDCNGAAYTYDAQGESEDYSVLVKECGEWDTGIAP